MTTSAVDTPLTLDEIARGLEVGSVVVLDLRDAATFATAHIPGSWSVALVDLPPRLRDPDDPLWRHLFVRRGERPVVVVVDDPDDDRGAVVAALLAEVGLLVRPAAGGVRAWSASGRPLNRSFGGAGV